MAWLFRASRADQMTGRPAVRDSMTRGIRSVTLDLGGLSMNTKDRLLGRLRGL